MIIASPAVHEEMRAADEEDRPVGPDTAQTIASWFHAPRTELSRLAHTGTCDPLGLAVEIETELRARPPYDREATGYLEVLLSWVFAEAAA